MTILAKFRKSVQGLSVIFTDSSVGIGLSYDWNFGDGNSSNDQNPTHTYSTPGTYLVVLKITSGDFTDTTVSPVVVSDNPASLGLTIGQMVLCQIPDGIVIDTDCFENTLHYWMLYLQSAVQLDDTQVFQEENWPQLYRVLIAKILIYEHILKLTKSSLVNTNSTTQINKPPAFLELVDLTFSIDQAEIPDWVPFTLAATLGNSTYSSSTITNISELLTFISGLGLGTTYYNQDTKALVLPSTPAHSGKLVITQTSGEPITISAEVSNAQTIKVEETTSEEDTAQGLVKYIETGPSRVEWFDRSEYWANLFKANGAMSTLQNEICVFASQVGVKLPWCKLTTATPLFKKSKRPC